MFDAGQLWADARLDHGVLIRTDLAKLLRQAAGWTARDWLALEREEWLAVWNAGLARLVEAAGVTEADWDRMPLRSTRRSHVLLVGARELGIETDWTGWPSGTA